MGVPLDAFREFMGRALIGRAAPIRVLEVGGGAKSRIEGPGVVHTVLEVDEAALARSGYAQEKLLGDAQGFDYGARRFEVAVFWNVLEHIADPALALARAVAVVTSGGLVVVRGPILRSTKGLVTALTPHSLHVSFYRLLGSKTAGRAGYSPFPVAFAAGAQVEDLNAQLRRLGCEIVFDERYVGDQATGLRRAAPLAYLAYVAAGRLLQALTLGRYGALRSEFILVARKGTLVPA
jgi:hypothetical protein